MSWLIFIFIQFTSFDTEQGEDFVQVSVDSLVEVHATPVATLSGSVTGEDKTEFRSSNNMMFVKFSSDSQYTRPGFNAVFGSGKFVWDLRTQTRGVEIVKFSTCPGTSKWP